MLRRHGLTWSPVARAWIPLGAGVSLLTLLVTGPTSDLTAHLAGFAAGSLAGLAGSWPGAAASLLGAARIANGLPGCGHNRLALALRPDAV